MKPIKTCCLLLLYMFVPLALFAADFYVSPQGNDTDPGTRRQPFRSLQKAQQAVREWLAKGEKGVVTVWINDGSYLLTEMLEFGPADGGNANSHVFYKAVKGAAPIVSGGMPITGWQEAERGIWKAKVPAEIREQGFRELFIEGTRATRARHPNNGYLRVAEAGADKRTNFLFHKDDFPRPAYTRQVELVLLHDWSITRIPIAEIDFTLSRITAVDSIGAKNLSFFNLDHWEKDPRYFLENDPAFLDAPGEWFYDAGKGEVFFFANEGTDMNTVQVIVPFIGPHLLAVCGNKDKKIKNLGFEGIAFQHCAWALPEKGYAGIQACHFDPREKPGGWSVVPAAVSVRWADNCSFHNCSFAHLGGSGLWLGTASTGCRVTGSAFFDISGNGVMVGEGRDRKVGGDVWWKTAPGQVALRNFVSGNSVTGCGQQFFGAVGIWCGLTAETTISGNHLFNLPYTGISIGWEWSPIPTPCRDNQVEWNHIHHIMQVLSDGGGIYMLGLQPNSSLVSNLIHDVSINAGRAESNGMFLDEGTTDVTVAGNIIYHIAKSPLRFHKATTNLVKENVLSCSEGTPPIRYNNTPADLIRQENNLVLDDTRMEHRKILEKLIRKRFKKLKLSFNEKT